MKKFKEVLVCVIGATPQIITETIYALAMKNPPVFLDKIYIVTTTIGREKIQKYLIQEGILACLIKDYNIPTVSIDENSIIVIKDKDGEEIDDIRNKSQSEATADTIISLIRELSSDPSVRLHCSIAGGRKTMSFYLGVALQLFGRAWDKLYHVLVTPEFESNPEFFYKPRQDKIISCRLLTGDTIQMNTSQANIELVELPFIRLSEKIKLHGNKFKDLIYETQNEINTASTQPKVRINLKERTLQVEDYSIPLPPILITIYATMLKQKLKCKRKKLCQNCTDCYIPLVQFMEKPLVEEIAEIYLKLYYNKAVTKSELVDKFIRQINPETFRSYIAKINRAIINHIQDETIVSYCKIQSIKQYGATVYGVKVEKGRIKMN